MKNNNFVDPYSNNNNKLPPHVERNIDQYEVYYNSRGKIQYFLKNDPKKQSIRFKFLERPYRWWYGKSLDFRYSLIPLTWCFLFTYTVYFSSVILYESEEKIKQLAVVEPEFLEARHTFENYKKQKQEIQQFFENKQQE